MNALLLVLALGVPPKPIGKHTAPPQPPAQQDFGLLGGGAEQPRALTAAEYKLQKQRYAEWLVHQRAAARAGVSTKSSAGKNAPVRVSGGKGRSRSKVSTHDAYVNQAMDAVRRVQGR